MTTENLNLPADLDAQLGRIADQVQRRNGETSKAIEGERKHQGKLALGVSALIQQSADRIAMAEEEQDQLDAIARRAARLLANSEDDGEDEGPEPTPEPSTPVVTPPATPVGVPDSLDDTPRTPRHVVEPPTENVTVVPEPHVINVRHWTMWQWLFAFIGAIIGLVIASVTDQMLFEDNGFGQVLWIIALTGLGFFGGGAIGSVIDD